MRPWRDIARELAAETDTVRIAELRDELNQAMVEQEGGRLFSTQAGRLLVVSQHTKRSA